MTQTTKETTSKKEILGYQYRSRATGQEWALCPFCPVAQLDPNQTRDEFVGIIDEDDDYLCNLRCEVCNHPLAAVVNGKMQELPYYNDDAFYSGIGVCFIPEDNGYSDRYSRADYLRLTNGSVARAEHLYLYNTSGFANHLCPGTLIDEEEGDHCLFGEPGDDHYLPA